MDPLTASFHRLGLGSDQQGCRVMTLVELETALKALEAQSRRLDSQSDSIMARMDRYAALYQDRYTSNVPSDQHRTVSRIDTVLRDIDRVIEERTVLRRQQGKWYISLLLSLGKADPLCQNLANFFEDEINTIHDDCLEDGDALGMMIISRFVEKCYFETRPGGMLDAYNYFRLRDPAGPGWLYDPDYESEKYFPHWYLVNHNEDYRRSCFIKWSRRRYEANPKASSWPRFWFNLLRAQPCGPTLFDVGPPLGPWAAGVHSWASPAADSYDPRETPRYLFRVFDKKSRGLNDYATIASQASMDGDPGSRVDLLSLNSREAARLLHLHLDQRYYEGARSSDNLVSWTNSLLSAIQYALWRHHRYGTSPDFIFICVVDTTKFPHGQFIQDKRLIRTFEDAASNEAYHFFRFRMDRADCYNGEYLSQGSLRYSGRGHCSSLQELENFGLYDLYPEFREPEGFHAWTNRVRDLRSRWQSAEPSHPDDFLKAAWIVENCFGDFGGSEMALMLWCFKARELTEEASTDAALLGIPEWGRKPDEVRRYLEIRCYFRGQPVW